MRDRRNTNLSVASTDSAGSGSTNTSRSSLDEKTFPPSFPSGAILPAPVTKENRSRVFQRRKMAGKALVALCVVFLIWRWNAFAWVMPFQTPSVETYHDPGTQLVGSNDLPDEPTALLVSAQNHHTKWTVFIPQNNDFPLSRHAYIEMCATGEGLRATIDGEGSHFRGKHWLHRHGPSYDRTFMDVEDAEANGLLPKQALHDLYDTCDTSMTFVLESEEASLGKTLMLLWLSYGLAKKEGRAFFIDDKRWAWGKYTSFFMPPPTPKCTRPEPRHIVPCPRNAKHLVISAATAAWTFGPAFQKEFGAAHSNGIRAQSRIYGLLRHGYEDLFKLTEEDAEYATERIASLKTEATKSHAPLIGLQIRRGDQHPHEFQYSRDYLPLERYAQAASSLCNMHSSSNLHSHASLLVASDDPDIFISDDLQQASAPSRLMRAQDRILLATKATLEKTAPPDQVRRRDAHSNLHADDNSGWEGGFFNALFFAAGGANDQSPGTNGDSVIPEQALRLRELVGRAYLLDMAVLGASDGVVCAISSASCRMLGVMLGWSAVEDGRWKNIDDGRLWSWDGHR